MHTRQIDSFFNLKNPKLSKIKEVLNWANGNALKTCVDMLDCSKSFSRVDADKDFSEVMDLMTPACKSYFRIILRKEMNVHGIISGKSEIRDLLEIGIRGISSDSVEYFIFIYLNKEYLKDLRKIVELKEL